MDSKKHHIALDANSRLHWYEIKSILGQGGFGITYLAIDTNLKQQVAIKEYLPVEFSTRDSSNTVLPVSENHGKIYRWGLQRFLEEAQTLARFKHPNIVQVRTFFEHNNTGYIVMDYEEGMELATLIDQGAHFSEQRLLGIILPILDGLAQIHKAGIIHRDIKPENIFIRNDESPVLLELGFDRYEVNGLLGGEPLEGVGRGARLGEVLPRVRELRPHLVGVVVAAFGVIPGEVSRLP